MNTVDDLLDDDAHFAARIEEAVDAFVMQIVVKAHIAVQDTGEADYLEAAHVDAICGVVELVMRRHRFCPPTPARVVAACQRLGVKVVPS